MGPRRGSFVSFIAAVLAICGTVAIVVAVAGQQHAPQPAKQAVEASALVARVDGAPALPPSPPLAIDIPVIGVHSELQYLGLTADNRLEVPAPGPRFDEAAWYKYSATPGSVGPAVILGHVDSGGYGPSVFFDLGRLQPGDEVLVTRADGVVAVFQVDDVGRYRKDEFPTLLVYSETPNSTLRLITCGGDFDRATGHYLDNVIVFASYTGQA